MQKYLLQKCFVAPNSLPPRVGAGLRGIGVKLLVTSIFRIGVDRLPESVDSSFSALLIGSAEIVEKPGERRRYVS